MGHHIQKSALQCRLQEAELSEQAVAAVVKLSRDPHIPTKLAAAKATGNLLLAELDGHVPEGCAMEPLVPVLIALLGRDQNSEVQRQGLQVSWLRPLMHQASVESDTCFANLLSALFASSLGSILSFCMLCIPTHASFLHCVPPLMLSLCGEDFDLPNYITSHHLVAR